MSPSLRITLDDGNVVEAQVFEPYARALALLRWAIPAHTAEYPRHLPALQDKFKREVEDALSESPELVERVKELSASNVFSRIAILGISGSPGESADRPGVDGAGAGGGWPAGGGGGGGGGENRGGTGGCGADGAMIVLQWSDDGRIIDVQTFVTPGTHIWTKREGADRVRVMAFGAGGGGGGGAAG